MTAATVPALPAVRVARASRTQVARWVEGLRKETAAAIRTRAARDHRYHQLERRHAGDPGALFRAVRDDPELPTLAWALADHQAAQTVFYQALHGEAAARALLTEDHPVPPGAGRRPAPPPLRGSAAGESPGGDAAPPGQATAPGRAVRAVFRGPAGLQPTVPAGAGGR